MAYAGFHGILTGFPLREFRDGWRLNGNWAHTVVYVAWVSGFR